MSLVLRISDQANVDMIEIWCTIAEDNLRAADQMIDAFVSAYTLLSTMPGAGRARTDLRSELRSYSVHPYLVFYRHSPTQLDILRVIHGSRDLPILIEQEPTETFRMMPTKKEHTDEP